METIEKDRMDIYSRPGTKIIFDAKGGWEHDVKDALNYLKVGQAYTIKFIEVGDWESRVFLEEVKRIGYRGIDVGFNTMMFSIG